MCGGQSNMEMAIPAATNSSAEALAANAYPHIRIFSVGHRTSLVALHDSAINVGEFAVSEAQESADAPVDSRTNAARPPTPQ